MQEQWTGLITSLAFPLVFVAMWFGICNLLSLVSGWRRVASTYASDRIPSGQRFSWQSGGVGFTSYRNSLNVQVARDGLFVGVIWPMRPGHRALFIPWSAIHDEARQQIFWLDITRFSVGTPSIARMRLPTRIFEAKRRLG